MHNFTKIDIDGEPLPRDATTWAAVLDNDSGLMWMAEDAIAKEVNFGDAEKAIASVAAAGFANFNDWRLPTVEELFGLADRSRYNPVIDTDFFPTTKNDWYWSSTPAASQPAYCVWIVDFDLDGGSSIYDGRSNNNRVRAVRSVSPAL